MSALKLVVEEKEGTISHCPHQGCGFRCCQFNEGNFIVLYPGEREKALARGESLSHLEMTPHLDGYKAICRAKDTSCCDNGYKPLDCQSYPFFPTHEKGAVQVSLKGKKCPLTPLHLTAHRAWVKKQWEEAVQTEPEVAEWLQHVKLVGYENYGA